MAVTRAGRPPAGDGSLGGSGRSIDGVHLRDTLDLVTKLAPELVDRFGGHAMAAGLTLNREHLDTFSALFVQEVAAWLDPAAQGFVDTDGELAPEEMTLATALALREAGPWGHSFPEPAFDGEFMVLESRTVGERHLKLRVRPASSGEIFDAIAFGAVDAGSLCPEIPSGQARLAYRALFEQPVDEHCLSEIRGAARSGYVLGRHGFKAGVAAVLARPVGPRPPGRPRHAPVLS